MKVRIIPDSQTFAPNVYIFNDEVYEVVALDLEKGTVTVEGQLSLATYPPNVRFPLTVRVEMPQVLFEFLDPNESPWPSTAPQVDEDIGQPEVGPGEKDNLGMGCDNAEAW